MFTVYLMEASPNALVEYTAHPTPGRYIGPLLPGVGYNASMKRFFAANSSTVKIWRFPIKELAKTLSNNM